jgi:hypothetical protein
VSNPILAEDSWFEEKHKELQTPGFAVARVIRVDKDRYLVRNEHNEVDQGIRQYEGAMVHPLVTQMEPMNCLSWTVGHLALQEHNLWI